MLSNNEIRVEFSNFAGFCTRRLPQKVSKSINIDAFLHFIQEKLKNCHHLTLQNRFVRFLPIFTNKNHILEEKNESSVNFLALIFVGKHSFAAGSFCRRSVLVYTHHVLGFFIGSFVVFRGKGGAKTQSQNC